MRIALGRHGTVTLPTEIRRCLDEHTLFEVVRRDDGVVELRPCGKYDPDQAWFWTERWQQMEREADEDYAAGRYKTFDNVESFLADLEASVEEDSDEDDSTARAEAEDDRVR